MPRRYKKYRAKKGQQVYGKPYRGERVDLCVHASGIYRRPTPDIPSHGIKGVGGQECQKASDNLSQEMKEREAIARAESERRKKMIAPMYNKGAYQYIGGVDESILHDIGKKK